MFSVIRRAAILATAVGLAACNNSGTDTSGVGGTSSTGFSLGGSVSAVTAAGLVLSNNGVTLPIGSGATSFMFTSALAVGTPYDVMVQSVPAGLLCAVTNGSGTVPSHNVTDIAVVCTPGTHSLGGTISGLSANGLILANNGTPVTVTSGATTFTFPTLIPTGTPYSVSVQSAPSGYTCSVANGVGTMGTADVANVVVTCSTQAFTVGGAINGYSTSGLQLANGAERIVVMTGATGFTTAPVAGGGGYDITVATQPTGLSCSVRNGTGTMGTANVTDVAITCTDQSYSLGGTVTGLTASGLALTDGTDTVSVAVNSSTFSFPTKVAFGSAYAVTVSTQPTGMICTVTGGAGTMPANNVNNVAVTCGPAVTLGGSVTGLTMAGLTLSDGTDTLPVPVNSTTFTFPTPVVVGTTYTVTATTQPNGLTCTISGGTGTVPATNVTSVQVTCAVTVYTLGGTVAGLTEGGLILANGSDQQPVAAGATTFSMPTGVAPGSTYAVTVLQQPAGMRCTLTNSTGTMPAANVTNVQVACAQRTWTWMNGSNTSGALGVYTGTSTPGARDSVMTWKDSSGNFWLFGGAGTDSAANTGGFNDVWEYNTVTSLWTYISGSQTVNPPDDLNGSSPGGHPSGRQAGMVWKDAAGNVWIFGGIGSDTSGNTGTYLCDLWMFNMTTRSWTFEGARNQGDYDSFGAFTAANWPGIRAAAATWTDSSGRLWMFGGQEGGSEYNDVWVFDPAQGEWAWMGGASTFNDPGHYGTQGTGATHNIPSARYGVAAWQDAGGKVWLFGGAQYDAATAGNQDFFNDLWEFDPVSGNWTWVAGSSTLSTAGGVYGTLETPASNNYPGARAGAATWADSFGNLWMLGGFGYDSGTSQFYLNDLWLYNPTSKQWAWVGGKSTNTGLGSAGVYGTLGTPAATNQPGGRLAAGGWTDSSGHFWLFGGVGLDSNGTTPGDLNDVWMY